MSVVRSGVPGMNIGDGKELNMSVVSSGVPCMNVGGC